MNVLVITGDKNFRSGHPRFDLQSGAVGSLAAVYWGRGALLPALPEGPFDVVTAQDPFWRGLFALNAARRLKARSNVQMHTDLSAQSFFRRTLARYVLRRADSVRVVSARLKVQVERMGVRARIHVLPIFVDTAPFERLERTAHPQKTILWIGRFEAEKDPLGAIDTLSAIRSKGIDAKLVMLGKGSLEPALRLHAKGLPVEFPGWRPPAPYLAEADVVLCTSLHESYGASIIEALSAGVPVVAPDVGVAKEAGARVVPRGALAEVAAQLLEAPERGTLKLHLVGRDEWQKAWIASLS